MLLPFKYANANPVQYSHQFINWALTHWTLSSTVLVSPALTSKDISPFQFTFKLDLTLITLLCYVGSETDKIILAPVLLITKLTGEKKVKFSTVSTPAKTFPRTKFSDFTAQNEPELERTVQLLLWVSVEVFAFGNMIYAS
ncbi:Hypothetical_protein [Hexamita inflata]|uniref:Hypothetical_protein n=1 Tax=Hexamita inflata TaxID=28002 RepID=A0AA86QJA6_9EUKA|nr:Hypothetical protein HINF_LOCUS48169 [Hexamita inflata]